MKSATKKTISRAKSGAKRAIATKQPTEPTTKTAASGIVLTVRKSLGAMPPAFGGAVERLLSISKDWAEILAVKAKGKVWRPEDRHLVVKGSIEAAGTVTVGTGKHDHGVLIVLGDIRCKNLVVASGFSLGCAGSIHADEVICTANADSVTYVAGKVRAALVDSGTGAWLTLFDPEGLQAKHVSAYVMVGNTPVRPQEKADLMKLVAERALDLREWKALDPEERRAEDPADYVRLASEGRRLLADGESILRRQVAKR